MVRTAKNKKGKTLGQYELDGAMIYIKVDRSIKGNEAILQAEEDITEIAQKGYPTRIQYQSFLNI